MDRQKTVTLLALENAGICIRLCDFQRTLLHNLGQVLVPKQASISLPGAPVASVQVTRVSTSCFTVRKSSLTSVEAIMQSCPSWPGSKLEGPCLLSSKWVERKVTLDLVATMYILVQPVCATTKPDCVTGLILLLSPCSDKPCAQSFAVQWQVVIFQDFKSNQPLNFNLIRKRIEPLKFFLWKIWLLS